MSHAYTILPPSLADTADASIKWFIDNWGVQKKTISVETEIHPQVELRPTFVATTPDLHTLCIEVSETLYANHLDASVIGCIRLGLPVKLFIAVPKDIVDPNYPKNLRAAKRAGVGIIEISGNTGSIVQNALSLSLCAVRPIAIGDFPPKYRHALSHAEQVFRDGAPEKACALIYDEIESLFRKIVSKTFRKGWWPNSGGLDIDKAAWSNLIVNWDKHLNRAAFPCTEITPAFSARMIGITPFRNASGHKPKDQRALTKRDSELRTRFEDSVDLFRDLIEAAKPLKI